MTLTKGHREEEKNYRIECETKKEKKKKKDFHLRGSARRER